MPPKPIFRKKDIVQAYYLIEVLWNRSGWLPERPSNERRKEATHVQIHRMGIKYQDLCPNGWKSLSRNGKKIFKMLEERYGFASVHKN
jgi:hypothetical protein